MGFSKDLVDKYKKGKKLYRDLIEGKRQDYLNNKIIAVEQAKNPVMFWKALKGFKIKYTNIYSISLTTWENFYNQIFPLRSPVNLVPSNIYIDTLDCDISLLELETSLNNCKLNKSPGIDEIQYEFYQNLPVNWKLYLVVFFNKILNQGSFPDKF